MGNNLDRLVNVVININAPLQDSTSFDRVLILGPEPAKVGHTAPKVGVYRSLSEVTDTGYLATGEGADIVGVAARLAFSQLSRPAEIYIATIGTLADPDTKPDPSPEKSDGGATKSATKTTESPLLALNRALAMPGWYAICPVGVSAQDITEIIKWTEAQEKFCNYSEFTLPHGLSEEQINEISANALAQVLPSSSQETIYYRSHGIFCKITETQEDGAVPLENQCINVAHTARCLGYHAGEETWAHKELVGITPSQLSSTTIAKLEAGNISYFLTTANKNITYGGKVLGGEWIDVVRFRDWLKNEMQLRVASLFIQKPKIPYTDQGIGLIHNVMIATLRDGVNCGGISEEEYDKNGVMIPSFITNVPRAAQLTPEQKASRKLTDCTFRARIAGAIHFADIVGHLVYNAL